MKARLVALALLVFGLAWPMAASADPPAGAPDVPPEVAPNANPAAPDPTGSGSGSGSAGAAPAGSGSAAPTDQKPNEPPKKVTYVILARKGIAPDLTITGGVRIWDDNGNDHVRRFMGRLRAGVALFHEPNFLVAGITGTLTTLNSSALGFEAQYINMVSGLWAQAGFSPIDSAGGTIVEATIGYTLVGLEYNRRVSGPYSGEQTLTILVHVPLGVLRVLLQK